VGDLAVSSRALAILAAGPRTARRMDLDAFVEQRQETRRFWMAVYELNASHPFLSKRVAALRHWQQQGSAAPVGRNPWSYPLAPMFGVMSGNPASAILVVLVVVVVAAGAAIPLVKQRMSGLGGLAGLPRPGATTDPEATDPEPEAGGDGQAPEDPGGSRQRGGAGHRPWRALTFPRGDASFRHPLHLGHRMVGAVR
jgi:hypothetical protein